MTDISYVPKHAHDIIVQDVEGETLILAKEGSEIHQLNEVASLIWSKCDGEHSIEIISKILSDNYSITDEQALQDVSEIIKQFMEKELLQK